VLYKFYKSLFHLILKCFEDFKEADKINLFKYLFLITKEQKSNIGRLGDFD
jgi:hypothetical protein